MKDHIQSNLFVCRLIDEETGEMFVYETRGHGPAHALYYAAQQHMSRRVDSDRILDLIFHVAAIGQRMNTYGRLFFDEKFEMSIKVFSKQDTALPRVYVPAPVFYVEPRDGGELSLVSAFDAHAAAVASLDRGLAEEDVLIEDAAASAAFYRVTRAGHMYSVNGESPKEFYAVAATKSVGDMQYCCGPVYMLEKNPTLAAFALSQYLRNSAFVELLSYDIAIVNDDKVAKVFVVTGSTVEEVDIPSIIDELRKGPISK